MNYNYFVYENILIMELSGELLGFPKDREIVALSARYLAFASFHCIIDLQRIKHMNSMGLSLLIRIFNVCNQKKGKVVLVNPSEQVDKLLSITKLDKVFTFAQTRGKAISTICECTKISSGK